MRTTKFIKEIIVIDPDTGVEVHVEIHKDSESEGIFGVDASYLDQLSSVVNSPFNGTRLECRKPEQEEDSWVDRHSVNCYFCSKLFDERDSYPADEFNSNGGGSICPDCLKQHEKYPGERIHELKTDSEVFKAVESGLKAYDIRYDDRGYEVADILRLRETRYTGEEMKAGKPLEYTGRIVDVEVLHILWGPIYGLAEGWVIMSIAKEKSP